MELANSTTKNRLYKHLTEPERYKIEVYLEQKIPVRMIASKLGRARSTIYYEINRGSIMRLQSDLTEKRQYRADVAQRDYHAKATHKGPGLKIGKDLLLESHIRKKLLKERYSPDAIIGQIKLQGLEFEGMISTKTLYNYIDAGLFSGIGNENLWEKRKRKKKSHRQVARVSRKNRMACSIEKRPKEANNRSEYGHWEGDCIKGPQGRKTSLFTLTERKTREEIIVKIKNASQKDIKRALDAIEKKQGHQFSLKFKSITFDNGPEFLDWKSLELSALKAQKRRTTTYFAHAYAAWERGSNEVQNKMIRRFIPKGTDIRKISQHKIDEIQNWMNNYPRKSLGYKSAAQMADELFPLNLN